MDDPIDQSVKEIGHNISCLHINSGAQLDDVFRLRHLFPYSKFVNDMRGLSLNLGNFFSSYVPLLDSFIIGPGKPTVSDATLSYADKILVADLLTIGKSDDTLNRWKHLKRDFLTTNDPLVHRDNVVSLVDAHNELLQQLVNRSLEFHAHVSIFAAEKPHKHSEANVHLKLGVKKAKTIKAGTPRLQRQSRLTWKMSLPDWKGLLNWTLKHVPEDSTGNTKPIAKEDVEFLQKAMESIHDHDDKVKRAAQLIQQSAAHGAEYDTSQLLEAFDTMEQYYEEHPGNASSMHRTGMLAAVTEHVGQGNREVLPAALSLLTTTLSNNEKVQEEAAKGPLMMHLLRLRQQVTGTPLEPKLITTVAAATRHCVKAEEHFVRVGGMQYISQCTASSNLKVKEKAALLIYHFVNLQKLDKREAHKTQLLKTVRNLMPLNVATQGERQLPTPQSSAGIQYAEVCVNLFAAAVLKYPQLIDRAEAMGLWQQLSSAIQKTPELEDAKGTLQELRRALGT
ncbi:PROTEIN FOLDING REGULATOR, putative [Babesia bigemina]|uniref:PROTEIN FOLDING REGULATOR, putative n=1 Tax=Babesia bigemina TaxID=5866 RepID=A0A061D8P0_BABBI|nr:PROTEIN FOLDING REGULATOR, putative [Babesia bigemina]CDR97081.1 PROTEIN FOLDING REGULATOR, putative [Babesia bigemina]|eukprot:XP_012769267.1 PROTEIN FOLDING REGULATOR, putative [Babesia bigemina]